MVCTIPKGIYTMKGKMSIISQNSSNYRKASKKKKSIILDELTQILHMNRKYLAYLLRNSGKVIYANGRVRVIADPNLSQTSKRGRRGDSCITYYSKWQIIFEKSIILKKEVWK